MDGAAAGQRVNWNLIYASIQQRLRHSASLSLCGIY